MLSLKADRPLPPLPVLQKTGWQLDLHVSGASMEPLLREGDTVTVRCAAPDQVTPGDLICFQDQGAFVLHRLLERSDDGARFLYEKGDAASHGSWIPSNSLLGIAVKVNGAPVDAGKADRLLSFSRREQEASRMFRQTTGRAAPAMLGGFWRRLKRLLLARHRGA